MEDNRIVELFWERSESAIAETEKKYGRYCHYIAYSILYSDEDAEECVNDTYLRAWESMPPQKPNKLSVFLGRITRNIAINRYKRDRTQRLIANTDRVFEEADEVIADMPSGESVEEEYVLRQAINSFVASLPEETRIIFVRRYWYMSKVEDIARDYKIPLGTVKSILSRTRKRFKEHLWKEGILL